MAFRLLSLFTAVTRLACAGFVVFACFAIPEAWNLNTGDYSKDSTGTIVYVPIEICDKQSISVDGNAILFDGKLDSCHTLDFLINACVASIIFACAAMLLFFFFDGMARYNCGPVSRSSVLGMSLFLTFILVQTAVCCYALYNECKYWEDYFMERFDALGSSQVKDVQTYGNTFYFFYTCIAALACAGLLLIDTIMIFCSGDGEKRSKPAAQKAAEPAPSVAASSDANQSLDENTFAEESAPERPADPSKWTNY